MYTVLLLLLPSQFVVLWVVGDAGNVPPGPFNGKEKEEVGKEKNQLD